MLAKKNWSFVLLLSLTMQVAWVMPVTAATLTFPGPAPCDVYLQSCIYNAANGDVVEIATNSPITGNIGEITKSITLRAADGFTPVLVGSELEKVLGINDAGSPGQYQSVVIEGLTFKDLRIVANLDSPDGHLLSLKNNRFDYSSYPNDQYVVDVAAANSTVQITDNHFMINSSGVLVTTLDIFGETNVYVQRNSVRSKSTGPYGSGMSVQLRDPTRAYVYIESNLINGFDKGIWVRHAHTSLLVVKLLNNTVNRSGEWGILIQPSQDRPSIFEVFNNLVSHSLGLGYLVEAPAAAVYNTIGNYSWANGTGDFIEPAGFALESNTDPLYLDESKGNLRLSNYSVLIDAGDDTYYSQPELDLIGSERVQGFHADIGAYEFKPLEPVLITDRNLFLLLTQSSVASAPYPIVNKPAQPFTSGAIQFTAPAPSSLYFGEWQADFPDDNDRELALNDVESFDMISFQQPIYAMGIDFDDLTGGDSPSTFDIQVGLGDDTWRTLQLHTPPAQEVNFIGIWTTIPFDRLRIREVIGSGQNEYFGSVFTGSMGVPLLIHKDGFEGEPE